MKKRRIIYEVDVDFPEHIQEETIPLWADGIARGIEHNKPEVKNVEYIVQVRDLPEVERPPVDTEQVWYTESEQEARERLQLPPGEDGV